MSAVPRPEERQQLDLGLVPARSHLPAVPIAPDWQVQPRLWGHSLHPMCSYLASFPAALAHAFVARWSRPGDAVLDPFSGRGTTPLQACAEGRIGVGNDLNPFAHVLTGAKVDPPSHGEARARLARLQVDWSLEAGAWTALARAVISGDRGARVPLAGSRSDPATTGEALPQEVALAFHPQTLAQLLYLRAHLALDQRTDRFLAAALTGILHGRSRSYLSEIMPNAFSMAPGYVRDFAERTTFTPPERDAFACLGRKLDRLARDPRPPARGLALLGDARDAGSRMHAVLRSMAQPDRGRLVVTSPPYLRVVKYGSSNWLRAWFLGFSAATIDATLDDAHRREPYLVFLREVLADLRAALADDAVVVLVIGDVETDRGKRLRGGVGLAEAAWEAAAEPEGYRLAGIALDPIAAGRKMTRLWGDEAGRATSTDRILFLGATESGRRRVLAGADLPVEWAWPPAGARPAQPAIVLPARSRRGQESTLSSRPRGRAAASRAGAVASERTGTPDPSGTLIPWS